MAFIDYVKIIKGTFKEGTRPEFQSFVKLRLEITDEQYNNLIVRTLDYMQRTTPEKILRVMCRKHFAKEARKKLNKERRKNKKLNTKEK